jgi:hypothetical protein
MVVRREGIRLPAIAIRISPGINPMLRSPATESQQPDVSAIRPWRGWR